MRSRACSAAPTGRTRLCTGNLNLFLRAKRGLLKLDFQVVFEVLSALRPAWPSARAAEKHIENVPKPAEVEIAKACTRPTRAAAKALRGILMAELIIASALRGISEDVVRFRDLRKLLLGVWIVLIDIWVVLPRQLSIRLFDFILRGGPADTENFIIISFAHRYPSKAEFLCSSYNDGRASSPCHQTHISTIAAHRQAV